MILKDQQRTYFLCTSKIKKKVSQQKYWLDETSIRQIRCLDKLDEGIFQAEICLLEIRQQLMLKSTFLLSHRNSDFHEFVKYRSSHLARLRHTFVNITPSWFIIYVWFSLFVKFTSLFLQPHFHAQKSRDQYYTSCPKQIKPLEFHIVAKFSNLRYTFNGRYKEFFVFQPHFHARKSRDL